MSKTTTTETAATEAINGPGALLREAIALVEKHPRGMLHSIETGIEGAPSLPFFARPGQAPESLAAVFKSYTDILAEYAGGPPRRKGEHIAQDLAALIDLTNRFKDHTSAVFGTESMTQPRLTSVLDFHHAAARFCQHRVNYDFPLAPEWLTWWKHDIAQTRKPFEQAEFAQFLEDNAMDLIDPPDFVHANFDAGADDPVQAANAAAIKRLEEIAIRLNASYATTRQMMQLATGLEVASEGKFENKLRLSSGETELTYAEVHKDKSGERLRVPELFLIAIPVFLNGPAFRMVVRLRYRLAGGSILWFYQIHKPEKVMKAAFDAACDEVRQKTALPLYLGKPE